MNILVQVDYKNVIVSLKVNQTCVRVHAHVYVCVCVCICVHMQ